ncbi:MAG: glycosyltransferase family 4 protein [Lachnospiraceae bacterium]|nr:glycosyltransferase family 4 protein [Lachnospiraceae bacterium]
MNIYYDYQVLYNQKYGGISRYYYELINTIERLNLAHTDINCKFSTNHYFNGYNGINEGSAFLDIKSSMIRRPLRLCGHMLNQTITKRKARGADILHLTYYAPYALTIPDVKKVVTVYDMIEEVKKKDSSLDRVIANKKECIYKADHVIAISESTKHDILKLYPDVPENKISVIYIGTSMKGSSKNITSGKTVNFPEKYILFVGQRGGYKNFNGFVNAVKPLLANDKSLYLLCVGGGKFTEDEVNRIKEVNDQVVQMNANDDALIAAYTNALAFVFPSLYEGFGIPTLEAFTCGCPAVISNTSSMPEVGGDAVLYFNPENENDMREQIKKLLNDSELRTDMIRKGKERLKLFSWDEIAKQTVDVYKKVTASG